MKRPASDRLQRRYRDPHRDGVSASGSTNSFTTRSILKMPVFGRWRWRMKSSVGFQTNHTWFFCFKISFLKVIGFFWKRLNCHRHCEPGWLHRVYLVQCVKPQSWKPNMWELQLLLAHVKKKRKVQTQSFSGMNWDKINTSQSKVSHPSPLAKAVCCAMKKWKHFILWKRLSNINSSFFACAWTKIVCFIASKSHFDKPKCRIKKKSFSQKDELIVQFMLFTARLSFKEHFEEILQERTNVKKKKINLVRNKVCTLALTVSIFSTSEQNRFGKLALFVAGKHGRWH